MKRNIGSSDRLIRLFIAVVAFWVDSRGIGGATVSTIALIIGILLFLTAFLRFCPLYALLHISTYKPEADFKALLSQGAVVVDVREPNEYRSGHISGSVNIPLSQLSAQLPALQQKTVITCCASGARSAMAKKMLVNAGITAYNGGGWRNLQTETGK